MRVAGVIESLIRWMSMPKPVDSSSGMGTALAPTKLIIDS